MKYLTLILALFLSACGGSSDDDSLLATKAQLPPNESTQVAALRAEVSALQDSVAKLQLIGKVHGVTTDSVGRVVDAVGNPVSFGPCVDMGVLLGRGISNFTSDPLASQIESFQQCTHYEYSVVVATNMVAQAPRLFWDGPNCTGNMYEWNSGGGSYNDQTLEGGVVFLSPVDNSSLMVAAGQTPQPILIQSVWVGSNPGCQGDVETQNLYQVMSNDITVTGVPDSFIGSFQLASP